MADLQATCGAGCVVHTIGHSTRTFEDVLSMLRAHRIATLVDVRSFPSSRKHPQWNQAAIIDALPPDITYRWIRELGGRRHRPAGSPSENDAWKVKAFRDYADYMTSDAFRAGRDELITLAHRERAVIMCSEAVPWRCHRRLITDALLVADVDVVHIMSTTVTRAGVLTPFARVRHATITYPKHQPGSVIDRDGPSATSLSAGR